MDRESVIDGTVASDMTNAENNFIELYFNVEAIIDEIYDARDGFAYLHDKIANVDSNISSLTSSDIVNSSEASGASVTSCLNGLLNRIIELEGGRVAF